MGMQVRCAGPGVENDYRTVAGGGLWGGTCTCPDGQQYSVGDGQSYCKSLQCEGGTAGECKKDIFAGGGKKVTCAPPTTPQEVVDVSNTVGLHIRFTASQAGVLRLRVWDGRATSVRFRFITPVTIGEQSVYIPWTAFEGTLPVPGMLIKCKSYHTCGQLELEKLIGIGFQWMHSDTLDDTLASLSISELVAVASGDSLVQATAATSGYLQSVDVADVMVQWEEEGSGDYMQLVEALAEEAGYEIPENVSNKIEKMLEDEGLNVGKDETASTGSGNAAGTASPTGSGSATGTASTTGSSGVAKSGTSPVATASDAPTRAASATFMLLVLFSLLG